jgi:hypothetical protein
MRNYPCVVWLTENRVYLHRHCFAPAVDGFDEADPIDSMLLARQHFGPFRHFQIDIEGVPILAQSCDQMAVTLENLKRVLEALKS